MSRSFAEALIAGDAVSPTAFMGEGVRLAIERFRAATQQTKGSALGSIIERQTPFRVGMVVQINHPQSGWFHRKLGTVQHMRHDGLSWLVTVAVYHTRELCGETEVPASSLSFVSLNAPREVVA